MGYIKNTVIAAASAATIAIGVIACGGEATPPTPTLPSPATATPTPTSPPTPTLARLTLPELQTATPQPTPTTAVADTPAGDNTRATPSGGYPARSEADLVPDNPQANDTILLQDIYQRLGMDYLVSAYALDETYQTQLRIEQYQQDYLADQQDSDHPYRHIMPDTLDDLRNGIAHAERFLAYPWHEPAAPGNGPWSFGNNGIRATLLDAATAGAERIAANEGIAIKPPATDAEPDTKDYEYPAWTTRQRLATTPAETTITSAAGPIQHTKLVHPEPRARKRCGYDAETQWTLISDHLPIYRVDTRQNLCVYGNKPGAEPAEHPIRFTASAVIAFQHRHTGFADPERRADYAITQLDGLHGEAAVDFLDRIQNAPYAEPQWRPADYMHYAVIGPVIVTPRNGQPPAIPTGNPVWPAQPGTPPDGIQRHAWLYFSAQAGELVCAKITASGGSFSIARHPQNVSRGGAPLCPEALHLPSPMYPNYHYPLPGELTRAQPTINLDDEHTAHQWERLNQALITQGRATDQPTRHAHGDW